MSYELKPRMEGDGYWIMGTAGEALGAKSLVFLDASGNWSLANAEIAAEMPVLGLTQHAIVSGQKGVIFLYGFIGLSTWTWTTGGTIYASAIAGGLTQTMPDMSSNVVQEVGYAWSSTMIFFNPRLGRGTTSPTYTRFLHVGVESFKTPASGNPDVVVQDNTVMLSFNQNDSESAFFSWEIPPDYAGGDLTVNIHWTNDGGTDDNTKNVKWEVNYQSMSNTTVVSGDHANSPKVADDTYTSASGWIFHTTPDITIAAADFNTRHQISFRVTALVAAATQLTGESHFIALMLSYTAYSDLG